MKGRVSILDKIVHCQQGRVLACWHQTCADVFHLCLFHDIVITNAAKDEVTGYPDPGCVFIDMLDYRLLCMQHEHRPVRDCLIIHQKVSPCIVDMDRMGG